MNRTYYYCCCCYSRLFSNVIVNNGFLLLLFFSYVVAYLTGSSRTPVKCVKPNHCNEPRVELPAGQVRSDFARVRIKKLVQNAFFKTVNQASTRPAVWGCTFSVQNFNTRFRGGKGEVLGKRTRSGYRWTARQTWRTKSDVCACRPHLCAQSVAC